MQDSRRDRLFIEFEKNIDLMCWITDIRISLNRLGNTSHNRELDRMFDDLNLRNDFLDKMLEEEERWEDLGYVD